jgi:CHAD domain-containing protein
VLPETLGSLTPAHERLKQELREKSRDAAKHAAIGEVVKRLRDAERRIDGLPWDSSGGKTLTKGLEATYRAGRRALKRAESTGDDGDFHELRKQVKYLRHELEVMCPAWKAPLEAVVDELHDLSDVLGEDHDLVSLREFLRNGADERAREALIHRIGERQDELRKQARKTAERLFAERPKVFTRRITAYLDQWLTSP